VVAGLRQLVLSTKAVEAGTDTQPVVIRTRDEVGELAQAFNRMIEQLRERDRLKDTFGKFLDPRLVSRLIDSGADQAERRSLTIFFSDIKQFTDISEQLTANTIVHLLNEYFGTVAKVIHGHRGIIDKYVGDAVMAFWVPPFSAGDDHARDACRAALAQQEAIAALRTRLPEITGMRRNAPEIVIRMGIATGEAVVGTIGSEAARSYTAIGDSVNLASRLEGINKVYGTLILISEETYRLAQEDIEAREVDVITVAGKTEPVRVYELMSTAGQIEPSRMELRKTYAAGLVAYRARDWDGAQAHFEECLRIMPGDGPARVFLDRVGVLRSSPPGSDWDGVWHHDKT
jgi:adenylate cyclase